MHNISGHILPVELLSPFLVVVVLASHPVWDPPFPLRGRVPCHSCSWGGTTEDLRLDPPFPPSKLSLIRVARLLRPLYPVLPANWNPLLSLRRNQLCVCHSIPPSRVLLGVRSCLHKGSSYAILQVPRVIGVGSGARPFPFHVCMLVPS